MPPVDRWLAFDAYALRNRAGIGCYTARLLEALLRMGKGRRMVVFTSRGGASERFRAMDRFGEALEVMAPGWASNRVVFEEVWLPGAFRRAGCTVLFNPDFTLPSRFRGLGVVTVHDLSFWDVPESNSLKSRLLYGFKVPPTLRNARRIIVDSDATVRALARRGWADHARIVRVHPGVSPAFRPVPPRKAVAAVRDRWGLRRPFVLGVGTLEPRKNWEALGEAVAGHPEFREMDLVLCGGRGRGGRRITERLGKTLRGRVHFLSGVREEDLRDLYGACRVFAYPSRYEGFGLPVVEAMACGAPVVTSSVSSLPEAAGGAALLADPRDPDALAAALARVVRDPAWRGRLARRGLRRVRSLAWDAVASRIWKEFEIVRKKS